MQEYPHHYVVKASGEPQSNILIESEGLDSIVTAPPSQFGGPGNLWSPEDLLCASVADCFILTFKAVSRASKLDWQSISCQVDGILDRPEKNSLFTEFKLHVELTVPAATDEAKALRLLEKAEQGCLITNSLKSAISLDASVIYA